MANPRKAVGRRQRARRRSRTLSTRHRRPRAAPARAGRRPGLHEDPAIQAAAEWLIANWRPDPPGLRRRRGSRRDEDRQRGLRFLTEERGSDMARLHALLVPYESKRHPVEILGPLGAFRPLPGLTVPADKVTLRLLPALAKSAHTTARLLEAALKETCRMTSAVEWSGGAGAAADSEAARALRRHVEELGVARRTARIRDKELGLLMKAGRVGTDAEPADRTNRMKVLGTIAAELARGLAEIITTARTGTKTPEYPEEALRVARDIMNLVYGTTYTTPDIRMRARHRPL